MGKKKPVGLPKTINPESKLPGRFYIYDGKEYQEEFEYVTILGRPYVLSSLGELWLSTELGWSKMSYGTSEGFRVYTLKDKMEKSTRVRIHRVIADTWLSRTMDDKLMGRDLVLNKNGDKSCMYPQNMMWVNQKEMNRTIRWKKNPSYDNKVITEFFEDTSFNYTPALVRDMLGIKDPDCMRMLSNIKKRVMRARDKK